MEFNIENEDVKEYLKAHNISYKCSLCDNKDFYLMPDLNEDSYLYSQICTGKRQVKPFAIFFIGMACTYCGKLTFIASAKIQEWKNSILEEAPNSPIINTNEK